MHFDYRKIVVEHTKMLKLINKRSKLAASTFNQICFSSSFNLLEYTTTNEPILEYKRGSVERSRLNEKIQHFLSLNASNRQEALFDVPIVIGDQEIRTEQSRYQVAPFDHRLRLARFYYADEKLIERAIEDSMSVRAQWDNTSFEYRAQIILKAAEAIRDTKRMDMMAATMLGQGNTVFQAEIDCACELIDFLRFNVQFLGQMLKYKPLDDGAHTINTMNYRGLEGFIAAVAPFNFTAIG